MGAVPLLIGSAVFSAAGSIMQGNQEAANLKAQAQAAERNALITRENARITAQQTGANEDTQRRKARQILGMQRAATIQSGLDGSGTSALSLRESGANAELDALNIRYEGDLKQRGLLIEADSFKNDAAQLKKNAKGARRAGFFGAATSALTAASNYSTAKSLQPKVQ